MSDVPFSVKEAPAGHYWVVEGDVANASEAVPQMPIYSKTLHILKDGSCQVLNAFCVTVVQAKSRLIVKSARRPVGKVDMKSLLNVALVQEESCMMQSMEEAAAAAERIAQSPTGAIEEALTVTMLGAIHERFAEVNLRRAAPATADKN